MSRQIMAIEVEVEEREGGLHLLVAGTTRDGGRKYCSVGDRSGLLDGIEIIHGGSVDVARDVDDLRWILRELDVARTRRGRWRKYCSVGD